MRFDSSHLSLMTQGEASLRSLSWQSRRGAARGGKHGVGAGPAQRSKWGALTEGLGGLSPCSSEGLSKCRSCVPGMGTPLNPGNPLVLDQPERLDTGWNWLSLRILVSGLSQVRGGSRTKILDDIWA